MGLELVPDFEKCVPCAGTTDEQLCLPCLRNRASIRELRAKLERERLIVDALRLALTVLVGEAP